MANPIRRLLRRFTVGQPIVVVSGLPRSGTSMAMKMLEAGGLKVVTDGKRTADGDNPKGYYEDERVMDLAKTRDRSWLRDARGKAIKIISFLLKDLPDENDYKIVFMRREMAEVLASQQKMLDNREEQTTTEDEAMAQMYAEHLQHTRFMLGYRRHFDTLYVDYKAALSDPEAAVAEIANFVGGDLDRRAMAEVVDPELYRNRA